MAGQPQEPSWTPAGQEQAQARAWPQQPSYTPPGGAQQDAYGYTQQQPAQGSGYAPPPPPSPQPGYGAAQDQAYAQEQAYAAQDQTYAGLGQQYQAPGQPGPDPAQWQSIPGAQPGRPGGKQRSPGERGFIGSLFDFSFTSMVTPKIIKMLYILYTIWTLVVAVYLMAAAFIQFGTTVGLLALIVFDPIYILLSLGFFRVILEAFMVVFRIYEETRKIREQGERQA
jgi:hypothetical protein